VKGEKLGTKFIAGKGASKLMLEGTELGRIRAEETKTEKAVRLEKRHTTQKILKEGRLTRTNTRIGNSMAISSRLRIRMKAGGAEEKESREENRNRGGWGEAASRRGHCLNLL